MTVFNVGDRVISIKERDTMPVGSVGTVFHIGVLEDDIDDWGGWDENEREILVELEPNDDYRHGIQWYFKDDEIEFEPPLEILGDNDDDCI